MSRSVSATVLVVCSFSAWPARAQAPLTLDGALARLRAGPAGQAIALGVEEARGRAQGAGRLLTDNPTVSGALGSRLARSGSGQAGQLEGGVELVQPLDVGGQRRARRAGAAAGIEAETAIGDAALRRAEIEVARAFLRALAARQRAEVAAAAEQTARRSLEALERRHQLRDVALLDVNVGRAALARATALLDAALADRLQAEAELKRLLALDTPGPLELAGDLRVERRFSLAALEARAGQTAEVRALAAQARQAEAEAALGRASRWPRLALGGAYERDDGANVVLGTLSLELPVFDRAQAQRAGGAARARRLAFEAETLTRATRSTVRGAHAALEARLHGVRALEQALPLLEQSEQLARKAYEAGQLSLADWIVVRREVLDTRLDYLDQLLGAAEAGLALAAAAGVSP